MTIGIVTCGPVGSASGSELTGVTVMVVPNVVEIVPVFVSLIWVVNELGVVVDAGGTGKRPI